ncbi:hypothetical protein BJV82DRAFT_137882 [Fennellomyces sp. T-0311]|nr:hypothetical protein BJV82DRAFT_137882 [Fennellomyces sp. T-0311]
MQQLLPPSRPFKLCRSSRQTLGYVFNPLFYSYSMFSTPASSTNISNLTLDILQLILDRLDSYSLAQLSTSCRLFHSLVRRELSFEAARWYQRHHARSARNDSISVFPMSGHDDEEYESDYVDNPLETPLILPPPVYHQSCMTRIGDRLYMPFMTMEPVCFIYDIPRGSWQRHPLQAYPGYTPFVTPVVAMGHRIYMFGGRQVVTATLSNNVIVLDTETWALQPIELMRGPVPRPRHDHTLDILKNRYLVVFGGVCSSSPGENDLHLFDTHTNTWTEPKLQGQIPPVRFGHASTVLYNDLYIFGGCQLQPHGNMVHDMLYRLDMETWTWYKYDHPEAYEYRRDGGARSMPGHPPRDRFYCTMQSIGSHKLVIFGGQTVRQDGDDNNILHAHSLRSIDVFNIRRNHWSAIPTTSSDGEHNAYPQDLTCFPLSSQQQDGHKLLWGFIQPHQSNIR